MIKYEVNKPFPLPPPMPGAEATLSDITTSFFDVKCYMSEPTPDEIQDWRKGNLRYGLFELDACPFFILAFETWNLDISVNVLKIKKSEDIDTWLNTEGNVINLFLIDAGTNILKAMRMISVPRNVAEGLKDILEEQTHRYDNRDQVEKRIAEIQHTISTDNMISRTKMYKI